MKRCVNVTVKRYLPFLPLGPMQLDLFGGGAAATMSSTAAADAAQLESGSKTYIEVSPPPGSRRNPANDLPMK